MNRLAVVALVPLVFLAGCGGGGPGSPEATATATVTVAPSPEAPSPTSEPTVSASTIPATPSGSTTPSSTVTGLPAPTGTKQVKVSRTPENPPLVTGLRSAAHDGGGFDRVVIDLKGARTGYTVDWVRQVVQDGSGEVVPLKGGAFLQVTITPANAHTESGKPTLGRTPVLNSELANVRSVVPVGDFEAVVTVAIALRHRAGFRVFEQKDPTRLVIDIAHQRA
ncbi:AMIN-like domain-containing (lipo)protein [Sphaerisporangium aureirubrum]|uniref:AMIN-like domain-containing protein n=1 Tax=Sphaerisporangium aureirubrum TaxID=1544736 RepID=A0ABW1NCS4_9ACTN